MSLSKHSMTKTSRIKMIGLIMLLTSFIMSTYAFGRNLFSMIIPDMREDIYFTYTTVGIIMAVHQVGYLCFSYISGRLAPLLGSTYFIVASVLTTGISLLLLGLIKNVWMVGILIGIMGICAATSWIPMVNIVNEFIHEKHHSKALGIISSGTSYGVFISGIVVPYLLKQYGWETVWIVFGSITTALALLGYIYLSWLGAFEITEKFEKAMEKTILLEKKKQVLHISGIMFLSGLALTPFQTYLIPYLREELNFSAELGGQVWSIIGLLGMVSGLLIGTLADKTSIRRALMTSYLLIFISAAFLSLYPLRFTVLLSGLCFGLAYYGIFGLIPAYIGKVISKEHISSIFGASNLALGLGSASGSYLGGWSKSFTNSFLSIYISIGLLCVFLIFLAYRLEED